MHSPTRQFDFDAPATRAMAICQTCGAQFEALRLLGGTFGVVRCAPCIDQAVADANAKRDAVLSKVVTQRWESICPMQFRTLAEGGPTDEARMLEAQRLNFAKVMRWRFGHRGLLLIGQTGRLKTRIAWRLLRRLFDEGRQVQAIGAARFDIDALELMRGSGFKPWFDRLATADVLFIDDLGKGRFTDAVESRFFALIDERSAACRPIIVTSNDDGASLESRMSEHRGAAIIRRLRDYCDPIIFP